MGPRTSSRKEHARLEEGGWPEEFGISTDGSVGDGRCVTISWPDPKLIQTTIQIDQYRCCGILSLKPILGTLWSFCKSSQQVLGEIVTD